MKTVLRVDDHSDTRDVLARLMRAEGYAVVTAGNGCEALVALDQTTVPTFLSVLRNDERHRTSRSSSRPPSTRGT